VTARETIAGAAAWQGGEMADHPRWRRDLTPAKSRRSIAPCARCRGFPWRESPQIDFPCGHDASVRGDSPRSSRKLGHGQAAGPAVERYTPEELRRIWFAIGCHLGTPVFQNRRGELMREIRDEGSEAGQRYGQVTTGAGEGKPSSPPMPAPSPTALCASIPTEPMCGPALRPAGQCRGVSRLVSSVAIHNEMLRRRPDLRISSLRIFIAAASARRRRARPSPMPCRSSASAPVSFTSHFSLTYIEAAEMAGSVPKLTGAQREALDMLLALAEELSFDMTLEPGDMHSSTTMSSTTPARPSPTARRAPASPALSPLLSMPNSRTLPEGHEVLWGTTAGGALRGASGRFEL